MIKASEREEKRSQMKLWCVNPPQLGQSMSSDSGFCQGVLKTILFCSKCDKKVNKNLIQSFCFFFQVCLTKVFKKIGQETNWILFVKEIFILNILVLHFSKSFD